MLGTLAGRVAIVILTLALAGCAGGEDGRDAAISIDSGSDNQPFPPNYRTELLSFMRTYLNNPAGIRSAMIAEPIQRTVGGRLRYVSCLRFAAQESDGSYRDPRERAILFINGRLDRIAENPSELCVGVAYAPFPDMEKLKR